MTVFQPWSIIQAYQNLLKEHIPKKYSFSWKLFLWVFCHFLVFVFHFIHFRCVSSFYNQFLDEVFLTYTHQGINLRPLSCQIRTYIIIKSLKLTLGQNVIYASSKFLERSQVVSSLSEKCFNYVSFIIIFCVHINISVISFSVHII